VDVVQADLHMRKPALLDDAARIVGRLHLARIHGSPCRRPGDPDILRRRGRATPVASLRGVARDAPPERRPPGPTRYVVTPDHGFARLRITGRPTAFQLSMPPCRTDTCGKPEAFKLSAARAERLSV